jgi:DtxR family transcriptional regulator, Mn-dependent transcriptional regulator
MFGKPYNVCLVEHAAWIAAETGSRIQWKWRMAVSQSVQLSASLEDYLEAIFRVVQEKQAALPRDVRKILDVSRSSVSGALKVLAERGLVDHDPYGIITLTDEGTAIAERIARRHEILRDFFVRVLAIDQKEADENACRMEHTISESVLERFVEFVEFVERCPRAGAEWVGGFGYYCVDSQAAGGCQKCARPVPDEAGKGGPN